MTVRFRDVLHCYPLRNPQRLFVSNAVSNVKRLVDSVVNFRGQTVLQIGGISTSENGGEQGIWA
jgi:hypothetical protein